MSANAFRPETILAADFGTATTRVSLFDVVEGSFRYVASGEAPSTATPPYLDVSEGLRHALHELQAVTGRAMLDDSARLITPVSDDGRGCDVFVATASAGAPVRAALVGLLPEVSLKSARRLAESSYLNVVETLHLMDRRRMEQQLDALVKARPDVVILAGGADGGASQAVLNLAEVVGLACLRLPADPRVRVLFVGNQAVRDKVAEVLGGLSLFSPAPNVRPELSREPLDGPRAELAQLLQELRATQIGGLRELAHSAGGQILPTAQAEGQLIRFLNRTANSASGLMSVNVGSAATSIAAAFGGELYLTVAADLGVGVNVQGTLAEAPVEHFTRWLPSAMSIPEVQAFGLERAAHPHTVPDSTDDLLLDYALARQAIRGALRRARAHWPRSAPGARADLLPYFDLIVGGGAALSHAPSAGAATLILLDALQPTGVADLLLDRAHLLAALGAAAYANPIAAVQVLESGALMRLGMAVSAVGPARDGELVCRARLVDADGRETTAEVRAGTLEVLPLATGLGGTLTLKPRAGVDVGFGPGRAQTFDVANGGAVGVVIDARGRPLILPRDPAARAERLQQWHFKLTGA